jgi:hypothetical protein
LIALAVSPVKMILLTIVASLILAAFLVLAGSFIRQSRFHYRYLVLNEASTRAVAVLSSFLLSRILRLAESDTIPAADSLVWFFFFLGAIVAFCVSVFYTNDFKNKLNDRRRHECVQSMVVYLTEDVEEEEAFGQKKCANTRDENWIRFRKELDRMTNRNVQVFLTFLLITVILVLAFAYRDAYWPNGRPDVPPVQELETPTQAPLKR